MLPMLGSDKKEAAVMIAKMVKEKAGGSEPEKEMGPDPRVEARKAAAKKLMSAFREDNADLFLMAMDELHAMEGGED